MSQPLVTPPANKYRLAVNISAVYTRVYGLREFRPVISASLQDDSVYDDEGWGSQTKTGLMWVATATLVRKKNPASGVYDVGQEYLRSRALLFGENGVVQVRWYDRFAGPEAYSGWAEVQWEEQGGDRTAVQTIALTLTGKGAPTEIPWPGNV